MNGYDLTLRTRRDLAKVKTVRRRPTKKLVVASTVPLPCLECARRIAAEQAGWQRIYDVISGGTGGMVGIPGNFMITPTVTTPLITTTPTLITTTATPTWWTSGSGAGGIPLTNDSTLVTTVRYTLEDIA